MTDYTVSIDDAIAELNSVLAMIDNQPQNVGGRNMAPRKIRTIGSIETVTTRVANNNVNLGLNRAPFGVGTESALLYLVNFADEEGYAMLAADARISTPVLAIVESGSISATSFEEEPELYDSRIDYGYDLLESFNLFDPVAEDYYVNSAMIESSVNSMILDHAMREVEYYDNRLKYGPCEPAPGPSGGGGLVETTGPWINRKKVNPMLTTLWTQSSPFNDLCPTLRWFYEDKGEGKKAPAGCVAIALAQIMAYHEYPQNLQSIMPIYLPTSWEDLKVIYSIDDKSFLGSSVGCNGVAELARRIGAKCDMLYTPDWSFALPSKARDAMSAYGYTNVVRHGKYDVNKITNMLDNGNPVFIASISDYVSGHAWVIDGSVIQTQTTESVNVVTGYKMNIHTKERLLLHCNWGWNGHCNGYYESGIFNLKEGAVTVEGNENSTDTRDRDYTWSFHIITYDNPNHGTSSRR